ncbi:Uncharacterized membrane protein YeaQ/YmgE, transglycosylase-associated protein family [Kytococcus aerolatus]|uniref:Uncharacterized membrane protein YeaQ/YmgE, transglycosylase-associated protein family n=1 Tax=Kytococcus aerolatus TaxID=592308 RepID=A0A212T2U7_9MICO|nr:GlsB/YeaQ/YmgE family stress response membrane protein [Kytococcus aerolatus]SNC60362.1 Uncharacterized membrane protein YeaQ/YmgE, transglycosylase-associated protein family [Kytococcus aerolatus]
MGTIIAWIIVGGIAGWIASKIMGTDAAMGIPANIIVGIVGAALLGFLVSLFTGGDVLGEAFSISSFIGAIVGACLLLFIVGKVAGRR